MITKTIPLVATLFSASVLASSPTTQHVIDNIDSSNWAVNPMDYGVTFMAHLNNEHNMFAHDFVGRVGINKFHHFTKLAVASDKWVVSPSLDHLYSIAIIDARKGFTVTVPENVDSRFVSLHIQDENHTIVAYEVGAGTYTYTADQVDTDTVVIGLRMATDGTEDNLEYIANVLQPQYKIEAGSSISEFPAVDNELVLEVRDALMVGYDALDNTFNTVKYDIRDVNDWERFAYVTAGAWGLSPDNTAMYPNYTLKGSKGGVCYEGTYDVPPIKDERGYFSITVYGEDKYLMSDVDNIVSSNQGINFNKDGTFTVTYGGDECRDGAKNFAYTPADGWGFLMRVYLPDVTKMKSYVIPEITAK